MHRITDSTECTNTHATTWTLVIPHRFCALVLPFLESGILVIVDKNNCFFGSPRQNERQICLVFFVSDFHQSKFFIFIPCLLLQQQSNMSLELFTCLLLLKEEDKQLLPDDKRNEQKRIPRIAIRRHNLSPFLHMHKTGNDQALLNCCAVDCRHY